MVWFSVGCCGGFVGVLVFVLLLVVMLLLVLCRLWWCVGRG